MKTRLQLKQLAAEEELFPQEFLKPKIPLRNIGKYNRYTHCIYCDKRYQDISQHYRKLHPEWPKQPKRKRRSKREIELDFINLDYNQFAASNYGVRDWRDDEAKNREFKVLSEGYQ